MMSTPEYEFLAVSMTSKVPAEMYSSLNDIKIAFSSMFFTISQANTLS